MSLPEISIRRKIAMTCFIIALILLGVKFYYQIGIDSLPKMDIPYVQILTKYPGASPEEVEVDVAKRIEDAVASIEGLKHTTSSCLDNFCNTVLEFEIGVDPDLMVHEVREKINTIMEDFPSTVETPTISKISANAFPVVTMYLTGDKSLDELYDYADQQLSDRFSSIRGVGEVRIHGGNEMQLHVILDRAKLTESNLTAAEVISRIQSANVKLPAGRLQSDDHSTNITYDAEFHNIAELKQLEISSTPGKRIYLGDIAEIKLQSKQIYIEGFYCDKKLDKSFTKGVKIEVVKKSDANAVKVINLTRQRYEEFTQSGVLPGGMQLRWFSDSGEFIEASVSDAWSSLAEGIILTAVLLWLFLHDLRTTIVVAVTMPVSIIITFCAMKFLNYTFDTMTLISLGCSSGILVSNSVVVIENIIKKMTEGKDPAEASITGAGEIAIAVAASALTNVVVFVPIMMMSSVVGMLISPFAGVMVVATIASLFVSFTLTPMLSAMIYKKQSVDRMGKTGWFFRLWDRGYAALENFYIKTLELTRRIPGTIIILILILCAAMMMLAMPHLRLGFIPSTDRSELSVSLEFPVNTRMEASRKEMLDFCEKLKAMPEVDRLGATVGYVNSIIGQVSEGEHVAEINLHCIPKSQRMDIWSLAKRIRTKLAEHRNMSYKVQLPTPTGSSGFDLFCYIKGEDFQKLEAFCMEGMNLLRASGAASDVDSSFRTPKPRFNLTPDRPVLRNMGITENLLGTNIMGYFDGVECGNYKVGTRSYKIRVKTNKLEQVSDVHSLTVGTLDGAPLAFDSMLKMKSDPVSIMIMRQDKERAGYLFANLASGAAIGDLTKVIDTQLVPKLPTGYHLSYGGMAELMGEGQRDFADAILTAIVLTFLVIAALMESWSRPFLIFFTIPLGFIGLIFMLFVVNKDLSMVGLLGAVMMIGIVVNNAILVMDEVGVLTDAGVPTHKAMLKASASKFRPIVMTSIASVVGMLPMAFGTSIGSEVRSSCGVGVVGGLAFSALLTLYLIPALYFKFTRDSALPPNLSGNAPNASGELEDSGFP